MMITMHRRRISEDDPFFDEGNYSRPANMPCLPAVLLSNGTDSGDEEVDLHNAIACTYPNCTARLRSVQSYDLHVNKFHMNRCSICTADFASDRLLDMHISELHDSYFAVLSKKKASYCCVVEGCEVMSWSNKERRKHLLNDHQFPRTYDFHRPAKYRKNHKAEENRKQHQKQKQRCEAVAAEEDGDGDGASAMAIDAGIATATALVEQVGQEKQPGAAGMDVQKQHKSDDDNGDMDCLVDAMARVRVIPEHISFGRRGRGRGRGRR